MTANIDINYWEQLLTSLNNVKDEKELNEIADIFVKQLLEDDKNNAISKFATLCPRMKTAIDKKTKIAHKIALKLYPIEKEEDKIASYIAYCQLRSKLKKRYDEHVKKVEEENKQKKKWEADEYKKSRGTGQYCLWSKLKEKKELSNQILNPTPMPVEIAPFEDLKPFFDFLKSNGKLDSNEEFKEFKRGIFYSDGRIDLCKQVVGPTSIGELMKSIRFNQDIKHFLLGNNIINTVGAIEIANFIHNSNDPKSDLAHLKSHIKTWYIAGNEINSEGIQKIAEALKTDNDCTSLWLKRNPLKVEGGKYLGEMLKVNKKLKILDLQNTGLLDEGIKYLMEGLKSNNTLRYLYLDANGITIEGAKCIADYFDHINKTGQKGLTGLWLEMNRMGNDGISVIAESLKNNKSLKRLAVGSNRIEVNGIKNLCDALENHPTLMMLFVGMYKATADMHELGNQIGNEGVKHICKLLENNKKIQLFSISHNNIEIEGINKIAKTISENKSLLYFEYEQFGLKIDQSVRDIINKTINENCINNLGIDFNTFVKNNLKNYKHGSQIRFIDSNYRNNGK
ncbi:MAG: hypothetical protein Edafosvirus66_2 [Edafosvirus sp.]|uniref:Leucine-rich repeat protein n=1 Tax=Edafosvirus sp. TaxID=2487765 RepID=A0A3G5A077_9VIRU|nr:MAG: hypothetical protein Edafosvirus66_2 [Edafosvirus sp.]